MLGIWMDVALVGILNMRMAALASRRLGAWHDRSGRLRKPALGEPHRRHPPALRSDALAGDLRDLVALHAGTLVEQLTGGALGLAIGPRPRATLLVPRQECVFVARPPSRRRQRIGAEILFKVGAAEMLTQGGEHRGQVAMRHFAAGVVLVELQRVALRAVRLHANRLHDAAAGLGAVAGGALQLAPPVGRVDAFRIQVHLVGKDEIRGLAGRFALLSGNRNDLSARVIGRGQQQAQCELRMRGGKIAYILDPRIRSAASQIRVAGGALRRMAIDQLFLRVMLQVAVDAMAAAECAVLQRTRFARVDARCDGRTRRLHP